LPCPDQLAVMCATNQHQIPIDLLHPFFRYGSVAEQEAAAAVLEAARKLRKASSSARGWGKKGKGKKGASSAAATGEEEADNVLRVNRYANLMEEAKGLASLGENNMDAYNLMLQGMQALYVDVRARVVVARPKKKKAAKPATGTQAPTPPTSSGAGAEPMDTEDGTHVENPLVPATKGRKKVKRHQRNA
jgi:hypothetical protein